MAWLGQIGIFLMLGLLLTPSHLPPIILPATLIAAVLILIARPVMIWCSLLPFHFPWREQRFISGSGLRGAGAIILGLFPSLAGLEHTETFFELVFFVVLISLTLQGWTIASLAQRLRIDLPTTSREPEHLTVPLPRDPATTLHLYDVVPESQTSELRSSRLPMSAGAQLVGVIRRGAMLDTDSPRTLRSGDQVMVLAPQGATKRLGGLFVDPEESRKAVPRAFFGEFVISLDAPLTSLAQLYGFELLEGVGRWIVIVSGEPRMADRDELERAVAIRMESEYRPQRSCVVGRMASARGRRQARRSRWGCPRRCEARLTRTRRRSARWGWPASVPRAPG